MTIILFQISAYASVSFRNVHFSENLKFHLGVAILAMKLSNCPLQAPAAYFGLTGLAVFLSLSLVEAARVPLIPLPCPETWPWVATPAWVSLFAPFSPVGLVLLSF